MAKAQPIGDGRVALVLTEQEASALWVLLYERLYFNNFNEDPHQDDPPVRRILKVLSAARTSKEVRRHGQA